MNYIDLTGQRFGRLTVIGKAEERTSDGVIKWLCKCDCGELKAIRGYSLKNGDIKSCGCLKREVAEEWGRSRHKSLIGEKFGKLTVVERVGTRNRHAYYKCRCECGNEEIKSADKLKSSKKISCSCCDSQRRHEEIDGQIMRVENTCVALIASGYIPQNNTSGVKGVCKDKRGEWRAYITFQGKYYRLGSFYKFEDAVKARKEAEEKFFKPILEKYGLEYASEEAGKC